MNTLENLPHLASCSDYEDDKKFCDPLLYFTIVKIWFLSKKKCF